MDAARTRVHLRPDQDPRQRSGTDPDAQVRPYVVRRIRQPKSLRLGGRDCQRTRARKSRRAVTVKFGALRNLPTNAVDIAQGFAEFVHAALTLYCKVNEWPGPVNYAGSESSINFSEVG